MKKIRYGIASTCAAPGALILAGGAYPAYAGRASAMADSPRPKSPSPRRQERR